MPITQDYVVLQAIAALCIGVLYTQCWMTRVKRGRGAVIILPALVLGNPIVILGMLGILQYAWYRKQIPATRTLAEVYAIPHWWVAIGFGLAVTLWRIFTWN